MINYLFKLTITFSLILFSRYNATAQSDSRYFELATDQDVWGRDNEDRDYTMGISLNWYNSNDNKLFRWLRWPWLKLEKSECIKNLKLISTAISQHEALSIYRTGITHSAFTPYHIEYYQVDSSDRPFAGNLEVYSRKDLYLLFNNLETNHNVFGLNLAFEGRFGLIGKFPAKLSQFIQAGIHAGQAAIINDVNYEDTRPIPRGWNNAIGYAAELPIANFSSGFEMTYQYTPFISEKLSCLKKLKLSYRLGPKLEFGLLYNDVMFKNELEFGWFAHSRLTTSLNRIHMPIDLLNSPTIKLDKEVEELIVATPDEKKSRRCIKNLDVSIIVSGEVSRWFWNSNLRGYPIGYKSIYTLSKDQVRNWTNFYEYGFRIGCESFTVSYLVSTRSPVTWLEPKRRQNFGRVSLLFKY